MSAGPFGMLVRPSGPLWVAALGLTHIAGDGGLLHVGSRRVTNYQVLEAMAVGLPVIAANRGALPEVVGDGGILVDPEDVRALADAIERVLSDDHLRRSLSAKGAARAEHFSWDASADALYEAYRAAAARKQRSAT